jgi:hypothetical protein
MKNININFADFQSQLKFKQEKGKRFIFCSIRNKYMVITPEEIVRQLILIYLMEDRQYPKNKIAVEKQLIVNGRKKRFDILVMNENIEPLVLVECKAPKVPISQMTFNQAAQYNLTLNADLFIITNGNTTYCCSINYANQQYDFLAEIPYLDKI